MRSILIVVLLATLCAPVAAQGNKEYTLEMQRRINAHGDEFMALALTKDERHLIIGAESGKLIVWDIAGRRILKQLDQGSPVHCVVGLNDSDTFIAAGGIHQGETEQAVVRKWHISTGASEEWQGLTEATVVALAFDSKSELVAAGDFKGHLAVWNATNGQIISRRTVDDGVSGLALNGREMYVTMFPSPPKETQYPILRLRLDASGPPETNFTTDTARYWAGVEISPDRRFMAVRYLTINRGVALFNLSNGKTISRFEAEDCAWSTNGQLVLFDQEVAIARVSIDAQGRVSQSPLLEGSKFHGAGAPSMMTGQVISNDGSKAWQVFQLGATLVEADLKNKRVETLYRLHGNLYALHVNENAGLIATGGDDELIRVRKLSDLSLVKEFKVELGVPQGVALINDGRQVVFSSGAQNTPTRISIADLVTGQTRMLIERREPFVRIEAAAGGFVYQSQNRLVLAGGLTGATVREYLVERYLETYAVSANGQWIVAANDAGKLFRFETSSGKRTTVGRQNVENLTRLTISNDGRYVYTTEFGSALRRWDTTSGTMNELASVTGQARTLKLSRDEREIVVGGNHRDVAVFDIASGEERLYLKVTAADFYVTNVWLSGNRLLFSTDAGLLFDGLVKR